MSVLGAFAKVAKGAYSLVMPVRPSVCLSACISAAPTGWVVVKPDIGAFYGNMSGKRRVLLKSATLRKDVTTFMLLIAVMSIL